MHCPVSAFHTFRVRSVEPLMIILLDIWEDHTPPVWPTRVLRHYEKDTSIVFSFCKYILIFIVPTGRGRRKEPDFTPMVKFKCDPVLPYLASSG